MSFETTMNKGFMMQFENGFKISVQWGNANYCTRKNSGEWDEAMKQDHWESATAEIAVFGKDGDMVQITEHDTVAGWLTTDDVAAAIVIVQQATSSEGMSNKFKQLKF
jgi:hypothetical protein